ncbi:hypothetical protein M9H77_11207 [Catharanthus roseus]|uniref:Uncharacterized protein n=1 Tax=Catharanthus roseus TaxID=4058 RepID=A0ACC0BDZ3_CATRO|nr:hypothetical protein M9H77_11207 [Catharanthus roseus]
MYHELEKITKKNKELKNKIDNLSNENSKLVCENKTLLESLEVLKNESESSKLEFQKLILENKNLCEKVFSLEKCIVDYDDLKKKMSDLTLCIENSFVLKDHLLTKVELDIIISIPLLNKHVL